LANPDSKSGKTAMQIAREAALMAGGILQDRFGKIEEVSQKGRGNIATDVDRYVEGKVLSVLQEEYPGVSMLGEETGSTGRDDLEGSLWIVDPLDGTRNYASGVPFYSVVIGLAVNGKPVVGVNYDPVRKDLYEAELGKGAFLNGKRINVSKKSKVKDSVLGMDLSYSNEGARRGLELVHKVWPHMQTLRIMGSSALGMSYVASGRIDLYFNHQLSPWDQVAGLLLVEEAGGLATDRNGEPAGLYSDGIIVSNKELHADFLEVTRGMTWRENGLF
jgi:myo-inositol-1(or 4)-monophosphatase